MNIDSNEFYKRDFSFDEHNSNHDRFFHNHFLNDDLINDISSNFIHLFLTNEQLIERLTSYNTIFVNNFSLDDDSFFFHDRFVSDHCFNKVYSVRRFAAQSESFDVNAVFWKSFQETSLKQQKKICQLREMIQKLCNNNMRQQKLWFNQQMRKMRKMHIATQRRFEVFEIIMQIIVKHQSNQDDVNIKRQSLKIKIKIEIKFLYSLHSLSILTNYTDRSLASKQCQFRRALQKLLECLLLVSVDKSFVFQKLFKYSLSDWSLQKYNRTK